MKIVLSATRGVNINTRLGNKVQFAAGEHNITAECLADIVELDNASAQYWV